MAHAQRLLRCQNEKMRWILVGLVLALAVLGTGCGVSIHLGPPKTTKCRGDTICVVHNGSTMTTTTVAVP